MVVTVIIMGSSRSAEPGASLQEVVGCVGRVFFFLRRLACREALGKLLRWIGCNGIHWKTTLSRHDVFGYFFLS